MTRSLFSYIDANSSCPNHRQHPSAFDCARERVRIYFDHYAGALFDPDPVHQPWYDSNILKVSDVSCVGHLSMWSMVDASNVQVSNLFQSDLANSQHCDTSTTTCVEHLHCILRRLPENADIFTSPSTWVDECSSFYNRCRELRLPSTRPNRRSWSNLWGDAAVSKLLARKRPGLVPVMDSVAAKRYPDAQDIRARWAAFQVEVYGDSSLEVALASLYSLECHSTPWITKLRLLDIIVWMHESPSGR
jgi:Family of unknown function (DUF6308)